MDGRHFRAEGPKGPRTSETKMDRDRTRPETEAVDVRRSDDKTKRRERSVKCGGASVSPRSDAIHSLRPLGETWKAEKVALYEYAFAALTKIVELNKFRVRFR